MGAIVPPPRWIPEDDLLLKNSIESGASLESLAKGAVQFSRRFTLQELHDRWYALLYDPIVAEEASVLMTELELSSYHQSRPNKPQSAKETVCTSMKRKANSIRKSYYAMRKRICNEPFDMIDMNILSGPTNSNADHLIGNPVSNNLGIQVQNVELGAKNVSNNLQYPYEENLNLIGDPNDVPGFGPSSQLPPCNLFTVEGFENDGNACPDFVGPSFQMPIWNTEAQDQHTGNTFMLPQDGDANEEGGLGYGVGPSNPELKTPISCDGVSNLPPSTEDYLAEVSNTLFDFTNDELLFADTNEKGIMDKSYLDSFSLLLLESPSQSDFPIAGLVEDSVAVEDVQIIGEHSAGPADMALHRCDQKKVPDVQLISPVSKIRNFGPEYRNGVICCTLNTEDPDIPSNDDVFLPFRFPSPTRAHWKSYEQSYILPSSSVKDFSSARKSNGKMKNNKKDVCTPSHVMGSSHQSGSGLKYPGGENRGKFELPKSNIQNAALRNSRTGEFPDSMKMERAGPGIDKLGPGADIRQNLQKSANAQVANYGSSSYSDLTTQRDLPKPIEKPVVSDEDELWSENEFDVPYFSDVEAMILDMDLSLDEHDLRTNPEACYQHEETKRTIIRLEQAANACMQRAIAAQGALAVLYGRCSKHYIKKSEVLLGRSTEDIEVDIDLGREKNGGKISRRQAIIKMDMHGTFHLKNVGKSSVYVNDKEVATGQKLALISGCLIEVRGLTFLFETNKALVQQHVLSIVNGGPILNCKLSI